MKTIPLTSLHADTRNSNVCTEDILEKLAANIQQSNHYPPLIVRPHPEKKKQYVIVDGHHRKLVLERLKHTEADCVVWEIDDKQAQLYLATLNQLSGEDNPRLRAELLQGLCAEFSHDDLIQFIPEAKTELQDLLALLNLEEQALMENIKNQLKDQESELPTILSFVLTPEQQTVVQKALNQFQPPNTQDPSRALVATCNAALKQGDV